MPRLIVHGFTISLGGYVAGPHQLLTLNPLGMIRKALGPFAKPAVAIIFACLSLFTAGQDAAKLKIEMWMEKNGIRLNSPVAPDGYTMLLDCQLRPVYRGVSGDTITLYTWNGSIAEDLNTFKKTVAAPEFNVYRYPTATQDNETVIVVWMKRRDFLWRHDTLYVLDAYNMERATRRLKLSEEHWEKKISDAEYEARTKELDGQDFGFVPKYKAIYFTGIFDKMRSYTFGPSENFRGETVHWTGASFSEGKKIFEINLETHTDGHYRFSEDMMMLETTNCFR